MEKEIKPVAFACYDGPVAKLKVRGIPLLLFRVTVDSIGYCWAFVDLAKNGTGILAEPQPQARTCYLLWRVSEYERPPKWDALETAVLEHRLGMELPHTKTSITCRWDTLFQKATQA